MFESVTIAGTCWLTKNLDGSGVSIRLTEYPQDYGAFFKWGQNYAYSRISGTSDGFEVGYTAGASTAPAYTNTGNLGYDYAQGLSGGRSPGDSCKRLGNYRTPTRQQFIDLYTSRGNQVANPLQQLNGKNGLFFGPGAQSVSGNKTSVPVGMIFIPASGFRNWSDGSLGNEGLGGWYGSSSVSSSTYGFDLYFCVVGVYLNNNYYRSYGFSVRCVIQ